MQVSNSFGEEVASATFPFPSGRFTLPLPTIALAQQVTTFTRIFPSLLASYEKLKRTLGLLVVCVSWLTGCAFDLSAYTFLKDWLLMTNLLFCLDCLLLLLSWRFEVAYKVYLNCSSIFTLLLGCFPAWSFPLLKDHLLPSFSGYPQHPRSACFLEQLLRFLASRTWEKIIPLIHLHLMVWISFCHSAFIFLGLDLPSFRSFFCFTSYPGPCFHERILDRISTFSWSCCFSIHCMDFYHSGFEYFFLVGGHSDPSSPENFWSSSSYNPFTFPSNP